MTVSMDWTVFFLFVFERWSIFYCIGILYLFTERLCLIPDVLKRLVLQLTDYYDKPLLKMIILKFLNPDYSEVKDSFGKPFRCKCGEQPCAPGVRPTPSNQGQSETCTSHAISKAIISFLDKKNIDAKQDKIEDVLLQCIGTTDRQWPTSFNEKVIDIQGTLSNDPERTLDMKIRLNVTCVASPNQIPNEKYEYILCTSYLSPKDTHAVYIEKKVEETGLLYCINSWGASNEPHPVILIGDNSNEFFRVQLTFMQEEDIDLRLAWLASNKNLQSKTPNKKIMSFDELSNFWEQSSQRQHPNQAKRKSTGEAYSIGNLLFELSTGKRIRGLNTNMSENHDLEEMIKKLIEESLEEVFKKWMKGQQDPHVVASPEESAHGIPETHGQPIQTDPTPLLQDMVTSSDCKEGHASTNFRKTWNGFEHGNPLPYPYP